MDLGEDLPRPQVVLALPHLFGGAVELLELEAPLPLGPEEHRLRPHGHQHRRQRRRAHEIGRPLVAQDGVIAVVAVRDHRLAVLQGEQAEAVAVVPAARTLQQIAAEGRHVADLRPRQPAGRGGDRRILEAQRRVGRQVVQHRESADPQSAALAAHAGEPRDPLQADQPLGGLDAVLHQTQQIAAARQRRRGGRIGPQQLHRLLARVGARVFDRMHHATPLVDKASSTRRGVSGAHGTRTPIAFAAALAIAASGETIGGSPTPITPRSS